VDQACQGCPLPRAGAWQPQVSRAASSCLPLWTPRRPPANPSNASTLPPFPFPPRLLPRSPLFLLPVSTRAPPPWLPPGAAASRLPASRRARPEVRRVALFLPISGIGRGCLQSPPPSPIPPQDPSSSTGDCAAAGPPPAKPSPPSTSW
jgi:hypothetical protein